MEKGATWGMLQTSIVQGPFVLYSGESCQVLQHAADSRGAWDRLCCCIAPAVMVGHPPELQNRDPVVRLVQEGKGCVVHEDSPAQVAAEPAEVFDAGVDLSRGGGGAVQAAPLEAVPAGGWLQVLGRVGSSVKTHRADVCQETWPIQELFPQLVLATGGGFGAAQGAAPGIEKAKEICQVGWQPTWIRSVWLSVSRSNE